MASLVFGFVSNKCILWFCPGKAERVSPEGCVPPGALAYLVQDGDPWHLSELPVQQGVWVDGVWLHIGGVAREQVGQADAGGTIAWGERVGLEGSTFGFKRPPQLTALVLIRLVH